MPHRGGFELKPYDAAPGARECFERLHATGYPDASLAQRCRRRPAAQPRLSAQVKDCSHLDPMVQRITRRSVTLCIRRQDDHAPCRRDREAVQQPLGGAREQHARQIVAAEHGRLLAGALGENHCARPHFDHGLRRDQRHPVIGVIARGEAAGQQPDARSGVHRADQCSGLSGDLRVTAERIPTATARQRVLIDQQDIGAAFGGFDGRRETGGSGADYEDIAEIIAFGRDAQRRRQVDRAQAGQCAEHALPVLEQALAMESLVVEPYRQEPRQAIEHRHPVMGESAARIDRRYAPP